MKVTLLRTLIGAAMLAASCAAWSQSASGQYVGASLGPSKFKGLCSGSPPVISCQDEDTAWRIFVGHEFNRYFAIELGLNGLGSAKVTRRETFPGPFGTFNAVSSNSYDAAAGDLTAIGSWPLASQFALYARLGLFVGQTDVTEDGFGPSHTPDAGLTVGLGARYDATSRFALRMEWQRFNGGVTTDIDVVSVGGLYRF